MDLGCEGRLCDKLRLNNPMTLVSGLRLEGVRIRSQDVGRANPKTYLEDSFGPRVDRLSPRRNWR